MKTTKNLGLNMPDANDFVEIDKINKNTEKIDEELAKKADASGGDISETVITSTETSQAEYPVPAAGDSAKTVLGKVQKFFADIRNWMKGVCLLGQIVNNCVTDNAKLPLSAAQGKVLMDLYNVLNTNQNPTVYSKQIWSSELIYNAWMNIAKIGRICIAWGSFVVKEERNITNVDLFNISNTGITPMNYTTFSLSSFNPTDQGGIGALNLDGKVVFALPESGTKEWRFNFSFVSS